MSVSDGELQVPPDVDLDDEAMEIARIWLANGQQYISLRAGIWQDPAAWGLLLADMARHAANAEAQAAGDDSEQAVEAMLRRILDAFEDEIAEPTDETTGDIEGP